MNFQQAHKFLLTRANYKFHGSHLLMFRPKQPERDACYEYINDEYLEGPEHSMMRDLCTEAFTAVDAYHDKMERDYADNKTRA